jgi:hypothetical protein
MSSFSNKKILLFIYLALLIVTVPVTLTFLQQRQENRSKATASTALSFSPDTTTTPLQKNTGDTFPLDIMVNPGNNLVTFVKFQVKFDNTKLVLADSNSFVPNITKFPNTVEGPIYSADNLAASLSIGSDPTKAINSPTKVGTITFKAIGSTGGQATQVTFTSSSQALSSSSNDQSGENVLSTTTPAKVIISGVDLSVTPIATPTATNAPTPTPSTTVLSFTLLLHGVGSAGDNPNPGGSDLSNKNPLHPQRPLQVELYNSSNQLTASVAGSILYNGGEFSGAVNLGDNFPTGNYNIKVKTDRYLRRLIPGIQNIKNMSDNTVPATDLIAGDINGDNILNILDYNILLNSAYNAPACKGHGNLAVFADLDDNGIINSPDYNLFLRELSVQNGD